MSALQQLALSDFFLFIDCFLFSSDLLLAPTRPCFLLFTYICILWVKAVQIIKTCSEQDHISLNVATAGHMCNASGAELPDLQL